MTTTFELNKTGFPIVPCTRCGGTGEYSYNQRFGTRCFKCDGLRMMIAPHAQKAWTSYVDYVQNRKQVTVQNMEIGDLVAHNKKWCEVKMITATDEPCGNSYENDVLVSTTFYYMVTLLVDGIEETMKMSGNLMMRRHSGKIDVEPFLAMIKHPK